MDGNRSKARAEARERMKIQVQKNQLRRIRQDELAAVLATRLVKLPIELIRDGCPELQGKVKHDFCYGCTFDMQSQESAQEHAMANLAYWVLDDLEAIASIDTHELMHDIWSKNSWGCLDCPYDTREES